MSIFDYLKDRKILTVVVIVLALAALDLRYGLHFGIEFVGGTQIPITLEHPVNITAMSALIGALQQRISTFGLKQVTVEGVGDSHVYVTVPSVSRQEINQTISVIQHQGRFQGIVNGKEAENGTGILKGSIGIVPPQQFNNTVQWGVDYYLTQDAARHFASAAFGQAYKPVYLFLDRPTSAVILINQSELANASSGISASAALQAIKSALALGNSTIPVLPVATGDPGAKSAEQFLTGNREAHRLVFMSDNLDHGVIEFARSLNYTVRLENRTNMTPTYLPPSQQSNQTIMDSWPMVGLVSAPALNPDLTNGNVSYSLVIEGPSPQYLTGVQKLAYADNQSKKIASILSGGALPVSIITGTPTTIPPTLGSRFLSVSAIAGLLAVVAVSLFIVLMYRRLFLVAPILLTTMMEVFIIISIIGLVGTIDLSAVAGIIAVVGTGVDAQIIITDEILVKKRDNAAAQTLLGKAFYIIWTDAALLMIAMLPLFFSTSLVTVIGFSESTMIGALLGVLITRPAYSAIVSRHYA